MREGAGEFLVIRLNVGPQGLQKVLQSLPKLIRQFAHVPAVIHLQDIRISPRRARTIQDSIKQVCPDYTGFYEVRPKRKARRYDLGVLTLLRNDVAYGATKTSLETLLEQEKLSTPIAEVLNNCAGWVLVTQSCPVGANGPVWHLNIYQFTSSATAEQRRAVWEACQCVAEKACDAGAALVFGGNLNAVVSTTQRRGAVRLKTTDCQLMQTVKSMEGALAAKRDESFSWHSLDGAHAADLDQVGVCPASLGTPT